jgi:hypothetical protein
VSENSDKDENASVGAAARHWEELAEAEERMVKHYEKLGYPYGDTSSYLHRAKTYRRTAEAMRKGLRTGKPCCSMCGGEHPNTDHKWPSSKPCDCEQAGCLWCF